MVRRRLKTLGVVDGHCFILSLSKSSSHNITQWSSESSTIFNLLLITSPLHAVDSVLNQVFLIDDDRAIFMFNDGSQAFEAKDFLLKQIQVTEV